MTAEYFSFLEALHSCQITLTDKMSGSAVLGLRFSCEKINQFQMHVEEQRSCSHIEAPSLHMNRFRNLVQSSVFIVTTDVVDDMLSSDLLTTCSGAY